MLGASKDPASPALDAEVGRAPPRTGGLLGAVSRLFARVFDGLARALSRLTGVPYLRHLPGPRGFAFVGLMLHFLRDSLGALEETKARYGSVASYPWPISTVIVYEPEAIARVLFDREQIYEKGAQTEEMKVVMGEGLVTNNDRASWAKRRAIVSRAMGTRSIREFSGVFAELADETVAAWSEATAAGPQVLDVSGDMQRLTFAIAGKTLLGAHLTERDAREVDDAVRYTARMVHEHMFRLFPVPYAVPTPANRRFHRHLRCLDRIVDRLIREARAMPLPEADASRQGGPEARRSILQRLVHARDPESGAPLDERALRDEILTLLIAGYETTSSTLAWVLGTIAANPEAQARLHEEIDEAGVGIESPSFRDTHPVTHRTILEAIRLYTAIPMASRRALRDDVLSGHRIPAGANVVLPVWVLHRDPAHWPDAETFSPDRFVGCPAHRMDHYVPFSKGARVCVGQGFAMVEVATIVTRVLAKFSIELTGSGLPRPVSHVSLQPEGGLALKVRRRAHG